MYELMIAEDLPKNGELWHRIRKGLTPFDFGKFGCNADGRYELILFR